MLLAERAAAVGVETQAGSACLTWHLLGLPKVQVHFFHERTLGSALVGRHLEQPLAATLVEGRRFGGLVSGGGDFGDPAPKATTLLVAEEKIDRCEAAPRGCPLMPALLQW